MDTNQDIMRINLSCDLCSLPVDDNAFTSVLTQKTYRFCCMGCKQVFHMLWEASDTGDPEQFKETELFKKCRDMGIIPSSANNLSSKVSNASVPLANNFVGTSQTTALEHTLPLNLNVTGMWCLAWAWVLSEMLKKLPGVMEVSCNFSTDRLRCEYNPIKSSPDQIISAINRLGYRAAIPGDEFETNLKRKEFIMKQL